LKLAQLHDCAITATRPTGKAISMLSARCSCGFTEAAGADETIDDHLLEVFETDDDKGPDGEVHVEGAVSFICLCGAGGSTRELDTHFLLVFTPADSVGRDGNKHAPSRFTSPPASMTPQ
jgi:hypothetical protein